MFKNNGIPDILKYITRYSTFVSPLTLSSESDQLCILSHYFSPRLILIVNFTSRPIYLKHLKILQITIVLNYYFLNQ